MIELAETALHKGLTQLELYLCITLTRDVGKIHWKTFKQRLNLSLKIHRYSNRNFECGVESLG